MGHLAAKQAIKLKQKLKITWNIDQHYWYPLYETVGNDAIAFNDDYIEGNQSKFVFDLLI